MDSMNMAALCMPICFISHPHGCSRSLVVSLASELATCSLTSILMQPTLIVALVSLEAHVSA
jgi:hypothetical protein